MKFILLCLAAVLAVTNYQLEIAVSLPEDATGKLYLVVYDNKNDFLGEKGELTVYDLAELRDDPTIKINQVKEGTYAFVAFIDENNNGVMDKNRLGIPKEPIGFSVSKMGLFGPPSFKKASYQIPGTKSVELVIERF
ncbi:MAG: DUF2141 domain-containing protein [Flavobacteriaceae bacterium]